MNEIRSAGYLPLLVLLPLLTLLQAGMYISDLHKLATDGAGWIGAGDTVTVHAVYPGGPADKAGMKTGDRILTVNGRVAFWTWGGHNLFHDYHAGETVTYRVMRGDEIRDIPLALISVWEQSGMFYWFFYLLPPLLAGMGMLVFWRRRNERAALIFFLFVNVFAIDINAYIVVGGDFAWLRGGMVSFAFNLVGGLLFHFCLLFPTPVQNIRRWKYPLMCMHAVSFILGAWLTATFVRLDGVWTIPASDQMAVAVKAGYVWTIVTMFGSFILMFIRLRRTVNTAHRNQLRTMAFGLVLAWVPTMLAYLVPFRVIDTISYNPAVGQGVYGLGATIFNIAIAIAIVRYKIWDIEVIIRRTVLYSAVVGISVALYAGIGFLLQRVMGAEGQLTELGGVIIAIVCVIVLREFLQSWIDRLFFRERRDVVEVILRFDDTLQGLTEESKIYHAVTSFIDEIFHFSVMRLVTIPGMPGTGDHSVEADDEVRNLVKANSLGYGQHPVEIQQLPVTVSEKLTRDGFEFLVPFIHDGEAEAALLCGPKKSGKPYSVYDRQLLAVLSQHAAAMLRMAKSFGREMERQLAIQRERERISRDLHDDLGSNLSNIALAVDLVRERIEQAAPEQKYLEQVSSSARQMTDAMRDIVWMVNPEYDTVDALIARMRDTASRFLVGVPYSFESNAVAPEFKLTAVVRRSLFMIFKEAINNAAKHSGARRVSIAFEQDSARQIDLHVADNGKGFDPAGSKTGNGLRNLLKRAEQIEGKLVIQAEEGKGCLVRVTVKLP